MTAINKQFDPFAQADQKAVEVDIWMQQGRALLEQMAWILRKQRDEIDQLRAERDDVEIYTEQEAAAMLRVGNGAKAFETLADLRSRLRLPHVKIGKSVRYTKNHIREICQLLEINSRSKQSAVSGKQLRRAA